MLDSELLKRLEYLSLVARGVPGGGLLACRPSPLPAGGTELTGHRDYSPGDDYRQIDWGVCARHDELHTRQFQGEQDLHVYLLLDCSRSMGLGRRPKFDVARRIAAALAYVSLAEERRVAVAAFSDRITADLAPIRGKSRILKLTRFLDGLSLDAGPTSSPLPKGATAGLSSSESHGPRKNTAGQASSGTRIPGNGLSQRPTNLAQAATQFCKRYQRHGPVVVISDLMDSRPEPGADFRAGLDILRARGYSPRVVQLSDPAETSPELLGDIELFDVETQTARQVTVTEGDLRRYAREVKRFDESVRAYCAKYRVRRARVPCDLPDEECLLRAIGARRT